MIGMPRAIVIFYCFIRWILNLYSILNAIAVFLLVIWNVSYVIQIPPFVSNMIQKTHWGYDIWFLGLNVLFHYWTLVAMTVNAYRQKRACIRLQVSQIPVQTISYTYKSVLKPKIWLFVLFVEQESIFTVVCWLFRDQTWNCLAFVSGCNEDSDNGWNL